MNLVLNDNDGSDLSEFMEALEAETGESWERVDWVANQPRTGVVSELKRYGRYFIDPLRIVFRKDIGCIAAWQQFYGINYAFWSRLFHRPKTAKLTVMTFIYKPKHGFLGRFYDRYVRYAVTSKYVDAFTCTSSTECDDYAEYFGISREKFVFVPWSVPDKAQEFSNVQVDDASVLASGRSNRDYPYLINELANTEFSLSIIDDTLHMACDASNVKILNDVHGDGFYERLAHCKVLVMAFDNPNISSGQTVLLHAWAFGKPVVCTRSKGLTDDYITDGVNGLVVEKKTGAVLSAVREVCSDSALYKKLAGGGRSAFLAKYSRPAFGHAIGRTFEK